MPTRQEDNKLQICLGRICISITMKFINEVVNGEITIILFVVTNLICVPIRKEKGICPFFHGLKRGIETHRNSLNGNWVLVIPKKKKKKTPIYVIFNRIVKITIKQPK